MEQRSKESAVAREMIPNKRVRRVIQRWILQISLSLNGHQRLLKPSNGYFLQEVGILLGLDEAVDILEAEKHPKIIHTLQEQLQHLERYPYEIPKRLRKNLTRIAKMLGLDQVEVDLLTFAIYLYYYEALEQAVEMLEIKSTDRLWKMLSTLLGHSKKKIKKALSPQSKLSRSGLLSVDHGHARYNTEKELSLLSREFAAKMIDQHSNIEEMIQDSVQQCDAGGLDLQDHSHLEGSLSVLLPYLEHAVREQASGVNLLFYGPPGTGKTELSKTLAAVLGLRMYEVNCSDGDGDPISGDKRLKAYHVGQSFLRSRDTLMLFDEIEDVIGSDDDHRYGTQKKQRNKRWFNHMLENNVIPTVWITNDIDEMDAALVRRFDLVLELPIPPRSKRKEILSHSLGDILQPETIDAIADHRSIAPALVHRASKVLHRVGQISEAPDEAIRMLLNNTLKAQGYTEIKPRSHMPTHTSVYDPSFIHTSMDLDVLTQGINTHPNARLCLYGPAGTGKSAFGGYIAESIDRPLLIKKGSDLMSKWVGDTEKNIAAAFAQAREEKAVLLFDEVDGFLADRRQAQNSWEVTQVNEMLVQMEAFDGVFIATTNLMDGLDEASLRRFDLKLEFKFLDKKRSWDIFNSYAKELKLSKPTKVYKKIVENIRHLTPGDFAAVMRQSRFKPIKDVKDLISRLEDEVMVKKINHDKKMGFIV